MKTETKTRVWAEVVSRLNSGEKASKNFSLQFNRAHQPYILIYNGAHWQLPEKVIKQLTGPAKQLIAAEKQKAIEESQRTAERLRKERESLEKRLDEPGFTLLAGEETEIVRRGTFRDCRDNLSQLMAKRLPRDPYCGIGCWVIVKGEEEVMSGKFDKDMYW